MHIAPGLIAAGAVIGFLVGLTGMGGGSLTTPFLILVPHIRVSVRAPDRVLPAVLAGVLLLPGLKMI